MNAATEAPSDNYALAYAQRRSWVMWSWLYGALIAAAGAAYVLASLMTGNHPETGVIMFFLGAALAALGWLVSAPKRFTGKLPKPVKDVWRAEQAIRSNKYMVTFTNIAMAVILLAVTFLTPRGTASDIVPITAMMSVWAPLIGVGILRTTKLLVNRNTLYDHWLQRRGNGNG
ncbi:hypothetical protein [Arthrobacter sp.]|uniref:hypothetical protein n=1 Tax=Arthrobacter sp. TaxID=1667 RepID=UPI00281123A2|nr:hypothetical protein [Arthrobacter sp.]